MLKEVMVGGDDVAEPPEGMTVSVAVDELSDRPQAPLTITRYWFPLSAAVVAGVV